MPVEPRTIFEEEDLQLNTADTKQEATKVMKKVEKKTTTKKKSKPEDSGTSEPRIIPITVTETDHSEVFCVY